MASNKEKEFLDFPNVPSNGAREIFQKERKYDSFVDEYRRIIQYGKSAKVKYTGSKKELFEEIILKTFKESKFEITETDLFEGNIIYVNDKKGKHINRAKISKYEIKKRKCTLTFQAMTNAGEIRTTIRIENPYFKANAKKFYLITFEQLFKRKDTFFGLKDEFRKRFIRRQVNYRAAILFERLLKEGKLYKKLPDWATSTLKKARKDNFLSAR